MSYASQDSGAAHKICDALRAAGIEVFLDQSELRGGDVWDQKIRREISSCALFIPVISANTASRHEGYFRLEWDLADQRSHMMARSRIFVVPVCLDETTETAADVPESFKRVQWTRLPAGEASAAFIARVQTLLAPVDPGAVAGRIGHPPAAEVTTAKQSAAVPRAVWIAVAVGAVAVIAYLASGRFGASKLGASVGPSAAATLAPTGNAPVPHSPPAHSIAVLPFVNMSGDKEQDYFSDGLTEELLNSLARINELQVAARTSAFSFKGKDVNVGTIGRELNVGAILEGSVRRSGHTVRITAQLINAGTGYHLWSETYDRDLGDVLKLQSDIANAVANALKVTLLGDVTTKVELGGTHKAAAFDTYLQAAKTYTASHDAAGLQAAINGFSESIRQDPDYAIAFAARSRATSGYAGEYLSDESVHKQYLERALSDAQRAIALAPDLAEGHQALADYYAGRAEYRSALTEYDHAAALAPGDAQVLHEYGRFLAYMGRSEASIATTRHAVVLDPLNPRSHYRLADALYQARKYQESVEAYQHFIDLDPDSPHARAFQGLASYALGNYESARTTCEVKSGQWNQLCLAVVYQKLGRQADAEGQLAKMKAEDGEAAAYQYAEIYAQWGRTKEALDWLETALRLRDPGLIALKRDPLMDPLRQEPRLQAVLRDLDFPE
ncbi:MAG: TIR domain-containing protein [Proteobacteria bacterium]|nr:TIR domain-containing protein [Pseudomonadota bacterium]